MSSSLQSNVYNMIRAELRRNPQFAIDIRRQAEYCYLKGELQAGHELLVILNEEQEEESNNG